MFTPMRVLCATAWRDAVMAAGGRTQVMQAAGAKVAAAQACQATRSFLAAQEGVSARPAQMAARRAAAKAKAVHLKAQKKPMKKPASKEAKKVVKPAPKKAKSAKEVEEAVMKAVKQATQKAEKAVKKATQKMEEAVQKAMKEGEKEVQIATKKAEKAVAKAVKEAAKKAAAKTPTKRGKMKEVQMEMMELDHEAQEAAEANPGADHGMAQGPSEQLWFREPAGELKPVELHRPYDDMTVIDLYIAARRATGKWYEIQHLGKPLYDLTKKPYDFTLLKDVDYLCPPTIVDLVTSDLAIEKTKPIQDGLNELAWDAMGEMSPNSDGCNDPKYDAFLRKGGVHFNLALVSGLWERLWI